MMLYPAMNKLKSHIPNRYMLVNVVALRARQIADDAECALSTLSISCLNHCSIILARLNIKRFV